jgi:hypothetical protein
VLDPRLEYSNRLDAHLNTLSAKDRLHQSIGNAKLLVVVAAFLSAYLSLSRNLFPPSWLLAPIAVYLILALWHELILRAKTQAATAADYYRKGISRMEDRWAGTGQTGDRFRTEDHVYADDLDLFGKGSLFELLSTARLWSLLARNWSPSFVKNSTSAKAWRSPAKVCARVWIPSPW